MLMFQPLYQRMVRKIREHGPDLHETFNRMDTDGDGLITPDEFKAGLEKMGLLVTDSDCGTFFAGCEFFF
jgi:Ca2+-binding EF-hand superfamily protein